MEVEMRFEQIIAAVTRPVVIATVREIEAVRVFVCANLHLWLQRMPLGMPAYSGSMPSFSLGGDDLGWSDPGNKRGKQLHVPAVALASCPVGLDQA